MHSSCPCEECRKVVLGVVGIGIVLVLFIFIGVFGYPPEDVSVYQQICMDRFGGELSVVRVNERSVFIECDVEKHNLSWYVLNVTVLR